MPLCTVYNCTHVFINFCAQFVILPTFDQFLCTLYTCTDFHCGTLTLPYTIPTSPHSDVHIKHKHCLYSLQILRWSEVEHFPRSVDFAV